MLPPQVLRLRGSIQHLRCCDIWTALNQRTTRACLHQLSSLPQRSPIPVFRALSCFINNMSRSNVNGMPGRQAISPRGKSEFCDVTFSQSDGYNGATFGMPARESSGGPDPKQEWQEIDNKAAGLRTFIADGCVMSHIFPTHINNPFCSFPYT